MAARWNEWLCKLDSTLSSTGMVPTGVVPCTTGTIVYDTPEHGDVVFCRENFTAAPPIVLCLIILLQEADVDECYFQDSIYSSFQRRALAGSWRIIVEKRSKCSSFQLSSCRVSVLSDVLLCLLPQLQSCSSVLQVLMTFLSLNPSSLGALTLHGVWSLWVPWCLLVPLSFLSPVS